MDTKDLELVIRDYIEELYKCKYVGLLRVNETFQQVPEFLNPIHLGYELELCLNKDEKPIRLAIDGNEKQFLQFIKQELKNNRYHCVDFFKATREYFSVGCCEKE